MPFRASRRHEFWSADIRYIEEHLLPDPRPVYAITIFENFSRMVLSSAISASQNQWDYLAVLADAIRRYGAPEALVTDGGGQFYSTVAVQLYDMLGIYPGKQARFVRNFMTGAAGIEEAIAAYVKAVKGGTFPAPEHYV